MTSTLELVHRRYGRAEASPVESLHVNPVVETILEHRSVRGFLPDALPDGTLELLIAAAQSAASSSNLQVWSAVAVEDPARKRRLAALAGDQAHIRDAPLLLVFLADTSRLSRIAERAEVPAEGLRYLDTFLMAAIDAALAAQNAVTAAESLGLGTVYIGALRNRPEAVSAELSLGAGVFALFGLCVGRPDPARPAHVKPRLGQSAVLHREQYSAAATDREVDRYDEVMAQFCAAQKLANPPWSEHSRERVRSAEGLRGRDRLRHALHGFGFELL
ncbi:MAG: nitroreductase [Myxococcaceae bacterium]|nr:nitroreductase [Myxococcaceae bacterium]